MERRFFCVRGVVQGVGFRPFVYRLARESALRGWVRNSGGWVEIAAEGDEDALDRFARDLALRPPPLAHVEAVAWSREELRGETSFAIVASESGSEAEIALAPDSATCADCLAELFDPGDRRFGYPFTNCTNCGPRLTIICGVPYDRARTTMAGFAMCAECRREYEDPADRRFHAEPTCCAVCGPRVSLVDRHGGDVGGDAPIAALARVLLDGGIAAIKGLGGFHLACDAANSAAVNELRRRKGRAEKPLAVMAGDIAAAEGICQVGEEERRLLGSARAPIVLLRRRAGGRGIAGGVAPGNPRLGVMLAYTPVHHLLMRAMPGRMLVMTSGNRSDEPIAQENEDARVRLASIADVFLEHDRPIRVRCDDSVTVCVRGAEAPLRRSRGYAPRSIRLPVASGAPILAVGAQLKATFALVRGGSAFLSHHLGDLDDLEAYRAYARDVALYEDVLGIRPEVIAHDLHPEYASSRYARQRAGEEGVMLLAVQHHHAHMAACMAENGLNGRVIGVTFDGTGLGTDGSIWGGEFLVGGYGSFERAAHVRTVGMPGGERAIREPWRMAAAHAMDAGEPTDAIAERVGKPALRAVGRMLERGFRVPRTSSVGRLFDAVASLLAVRDGVTYEGQAAIELEWLAECSGDGGVYPYGIEEGVAGDGGTGPLVVDTRPVIRAILADVRAGADRAVVARRFHNTVGALTVEVCGRVLRTTSLDRVVLSGGVFQNTILLEMTIAGLEEAGFSVYRHRVVPSGDGGIALGQAAVASAILASREHLAAPSAAGVEESPCIAGT